MGLKNWLFKGGAKTVMAGANDILKTVDQLHSSAEEKAEIRAKIITAVVNAQSQVLVSEAKSESFLTRTWRPITALSFTGLVISKYFLFPIVAAIFPATAPVLVAIALPDGILTLLTVMIGGYTGGREVTKLVKAAVPILSGRQAIRLAKIEAKGLD